MVSEYLTFVGLGLKFRTREKQVGLQASGFVVFLGQLALNKWFTTQLTHIT